MARDMVGAVARKLGNAGKCITGQQRIETAERAGVARNALPNARLVDVYGADAIRLMGYIEARPELGQPTAPGLPYIRAEIHYAAQHEMALTLSDALIRRTHVIYEAPDAGLPQAPVAAALMAEKLGWDAAEQERQVTEYARQAALTRNFRS